MINCIWDTAKAEANFRKHGVRFEEAAYVFGDPFGVEWIDERENHGEERVIILGVSGGRILNVVYTERGDCIPIISARKAAKNEQDIYYRQNAR